MSPFLGFPGNFIEKHGSTIGVDFSMKTVTVDGKRVKVGHELIRGDTEC